MISSKEDKIRGRNWCQGGIGVSSFSHNELMLPRWKIELTPFVSLWVIWARRSALDFVSASDGQSQRSADGRCHGDQQRHETLDC
jgi:hypothetical protein